MLVRVLKWLQWSRQNTNQRKTCSKTYSSYFCLQAALDTTILYLCAIEMVRVVSCCVLTSPKRTHSNIFITANAGD